MSSFRRKTRIDSLYRTALTGKYTWDQLKEMAAAMGVSRPTANSYIDAVYQRLVKAGHIKE